MLDRMKRNFVRRRDDRGASAVEYGMLIAAIAGILVAIVFAFFTFVGDTFEDTCTQIAAGAEGGPENCDPPSES